MEVIIDSVGFVTEFDALKCVHAISLDRVSQSVGGDFVGGTTKFDAMVPSAALYSLYIYMMRVY